MIGGVADLELHDEVVVWMDARDVAEWDRMVVVRHCCIERSGWPRWGQADDFRAERPPRRPESAPKWGESGVPAVQRRATSPQCNSASSRAAVRSIHHPST